MLELLLNRPRTSVASSRRLALACSLLTLVDRVIRQDAWRYNNVSVHHGWVSQTDTRTILAWTLLTIFWRVWSPWPTGGHRQFHMKIHSCHVYTERHRKNDLTYIHGYGDRLITYVILHGLGYVILHGLDWALGLSLRCLTSQPFWEGTDSQRAEPATLHYPVDAPHSTVASASLPPAEALAR